MHEISFAVYFSKFKLNGVGSNMHIDFSQSHSFFNAFQTLHLNIQLTVSEKRTFKHRSTSGQVEMFIFISVNRLEILIGNNTTIVYHTKLFSETRIV